MDHQRYNRQMILPGFGEEAQKKLSRAKVLVIGAGGLGCPALLYLTAVGVGKIGIVDFDLVELSNLHRQVLFTEADLGRPKALAAAEKLHARNSQVSIIPYQMALSNQNAPDLFAEYDLVMDGSDNFATRYLVNDTCALLHKPLVYGSIYRYEGQVAVFNQPDKNGLSTQYRDLFPQSPGMEEIPNCAEAGVMGVLPGIIGNFQANEVIKLITGLGAPLTNKLLTFNSNTNETYTMEIVPHPKGKAHMPNSLLELQDMDYGEICASDFAQDIPADQLELFLDRHPEIQLVDLREQFETPKIESWSYQALPMSQLEKKMNELASNDEILVYCQSGIRSSQAAKRIAKAYPEKKIYQLKGGINSWLSLKS